MAPGEVWPTDKYNQGKPMHYREYDFHGSWFDVCPLCGALVGDTTIHTAWHVNPISESE